MLVHQYVSYYARDIPEQPFLTVSGRTTNYGQLERLSNQFANGVLALGLKAGDRIAVLGENSLEHMVALIGASKMGGVFAPLNHRLAPRELSEIISDANARLLLVTSDMEPVLDLMRSDLPKNLRLIIRAGNSSLELETWLKEQSADPIAGERRDKDPLLQLYTSGTTGRPKGVVSSHFNLITMLNMYKVATPFRFNQGDTTILFAPLFHMAGLGWLMLQLSSGSHTLLHEDFNPVRIIDEVEQYSIASIFMVPAMIMAVLQLPGIEARDFSHLKQVFYGASPITEPVLRQAMQVFKCDFVQMYGMTETTGTVVDLSAEDHRRALGGRAELLRSVGRASMGVEVKVVDLDGNQVTTGEVGEILVKSPTNMIGYHNRPEETQKTLKKGWVHTGDAGYLDAEGYIYLKDRIKDMVISGGENIYPVEVENVLIAHSDIRDVAVIGVPDDKFGEALLAFIVLEEGAALNGDAIIAFCRDKIAGYKIPRQFRQIDEIPRNPSGKVLKKILREPFWAE